MINYGQEAIDNLDNFELWNNNYCENDYLIHIEHPEFTSLCPRSGYPDSGSIIIDYYPDKLIVELKSIKLYVNSFRNKPISHEGVTNEIFNKLWEEVKPKSLRVIGDFMRRGGVKTVVTLKKGNHIFDAYMANIL